MMKMLIVDDDIRLRKLVRTYAEVDGFKCREAEDADGAVAAVREETFDILILDVMMPGRDGFEALADIREISQVPVIMLTARSEEYDKLFGFNLGADDYVLKPFSPKELMARVSAVLKRSKGKQGNMLSFGKLAIQKEFRRVTINGEQISLPPKEFDLLVKLAENEHIVFNREQLLETVWGYDYFGDARTVDTHVKSLREHIGECRSFIRTVWGVGYTFEYITKPGQ